MLTPPGGSTKRPGVAATGGVPAAGARAEPLGDLLLEHQRHRQKGIRLTQPSDQQGGCDVVGQIGDDTGRRAAGEPGRVELQRVAVNHLEPAIGRAQLGQRRDAAQTQALECP